MKNTKISKKEIKRILDLSRISVEKDEMNKLTEDINDIIQEMEKIRTLSQDFYLSNVVFQQVNNQFSFTSKKCDFSLAVIRENFPVTLSSNPVVPPIKGKEE